MSVEGGWYLVSRYASHWAHCELVGGVGLYLLQSFITYHNRPSLVIINRNVYFHHHHHSNSTLTIRSTSIPPSSPNTHHVRPRRRPRSRPRWTFPSPRRQHVPQTSPISLPRSISHRSLPPRRQKSRPKRVARWPQRLERRQYQHGFVSSLNGHREAYRSVQVLVQRGLLASVTIRGRGKTGERMRLRDLVVIDDSSHPLSIAFWSFCIHQLIQAYTSLSTLLTNSQP